jgi:hypothetical protein
MSTIQEFNEFVSVKSFVTSTWADYAEEEEET